MATRRVYNKEFNAIVTEKSYTFDVTNIDAFIKLLDNDELKLLLDTQLEYEHYEAAEIIKKEIDNRKNKE